MDQHEFNSKYECLNIAPKTVLRCFLLGLDDEKIAILRRLLTDEEVLFLLSILNEDEIFLIFSTKETDQIQKQRVYDKINNNKIVQRLLQLNDQVSEETLKKLKENARANLRNAAKENFGISGQSFREELVTLFLTHKRELVGFKAVIKFDLYIYWTPDVRDFILEENTLTAIKESPSLVRIKSPYKMGKRFLVNKLLARLTRDKDDFIINYDFEIHPQQETLSNYEQLMKDLCRKFIKQLNLATDLQTLDEWQDFILPNDNITEYFEQYFLESNHDTILVFYNCDIVFEKEYRQDFCRLLAMWFNTANMGHKNIHKLWNKLHIIITHSTDIYANFDIRDNNCSPLANIGHSITLKPWTIRQVKDLSQQNLLNLEQQDIEQLYQWLKGHPYLTDAVCKYLTEHRSNINIQEISNYNSLQNINRIANHLQRLLGKLRQSPDLINAYRKVVNSDQTIKLDKFTAWKLYGLGLTHIDERGKSSCFCQLYRQYFKENL